MNYDMLGLERFSNSRWELHKLKRMAPPMSTEIELKFQISPSDVEQVPHIELLQQLAKEEGEYYLMSWYYDTPHLDLAMRGFSMRIRKKENELIQTIKKKNAEAKDGLHEREEWEYEIPSREFDLSMVPKDVRNKLSPFLKDLDVLFTTDFLRKYWLLETSSGCEVEFALDHGEIRAGDQRNMICEVELELKKGKKEDLLALSKQLQARFELEPSNLSKAARGYLLYNSGHAA